MSLYPAGFDVERIRNAMRNTKLLSASKMKGATTYKWQLILDGNQRVMFKPRIRYLMCCVCVCGGGGGGVKHTMCRALYLRRRFHNTDTITCIIGEYN